MSSLTVCAVTGSRADYGHLVPVLRAIAAEPALSLQLVVTGSHLSSSFGSTCQAIEQDGFFIHDKVEMLLASDSPVGVATSLGLGVIGMAQALQRLQPDLLLVLGDRFEILAAAQAALILRIPVAHIAGGDVTEGAFDEAIRHSITKMSHLHFPTNSRAAQRLRQLGEDPSRIHLAGDPALDSLRGMELLGRAEVEQALGFPFREKNVLVTFHPVTLEEGQAADQCGELLAALDSFGNRLGIVFTQPNADPEGRVIQRMIEQFIAVRENACMRHSLGQLLYWSTVAQVDAVVGNSSSGLYEVPSLGKPTVNIGDRQRGRLTASSVISCSPDALSISDAIRQAFETDCSNTVNPYGDGNASRRIVAVLKGITDPKTLLKKAFFEMG